MEIQMIVDNKIIFVGFTSGEQIAMVSDDALKYRIGLYPADPLHTESTNIEVYSLDSWLERLCWWMDKYSMVVEFKHDEDGNCIVQRMK